MVTKKQELAELKTVTKKIHRHPKFFEHIRELYVEGDVGKDGIRKWSTLRSLSKRFKVKPSTLDMHSTNENWKEFRVQFQLQLESARQQKRIEVLSNASVEFDNHCFDAANQLVDKVLTKLSEATELFDLESIGRSLEKAQKVGRLASGESTSNSKKELNVTFSKGLDMIRKNLESHPDILKKLKDETVDGDASILPDIDLSEVDDGIYERLKIREED